MFKSISSTFSSTEVEIMHAALDHFPNVDFSSVSVADNFIESRLSAAFEFRHTTIHISKITSGICTEEDFRFAIIHEMRHAEQFLAGRLQQEGYMSLKWDDGEPVNMAFVTPQGYVRLPWEIDANTFAYGITGDFPTRNDIILTNINSVKNVQAYI